MENLSEYCQNWIDKKNKPKPIKTSTYSIFRISNPLKTKITFIGYHTGFLNEIKELYERCFDKWKSEGIHEKMILLPFALIGRKPTIEIIERYTATDWELSNRLDDLIKERENLTLHFSL